MSTTSVQKHTKSGFTTLGIAITAVLIALSSLLTMFTKIPVPGIRGYFNVGDAVIMLAALLLGRKEGTLVGAIGPALADLLLGYAVFVPITFLVKGIEGFLVATIYGKKKSFSSALLLIVGRFGKRFLISESASSSFHSFLIKQAFSFPPSYSTTR